MAWSPSASASRKYSFRSIPADQASPSPDSTSTPTSSRNSMTAELADQLAIIGLRISEASVLLLIGARADMTSAEIGKILDIQRANMVPLLARLEQAGLIARLPLDRKSQAIMLTQKVGLPRLVQVQAIISAFEAALLARIPAAHRDHLLPALHALWDGRRINRDDLRPD